MSLAWPCTPTQPADVPACATGSPVNLFFDNFEAGLGNFSAQTFVGANGWAWFSGYATSGTHSLFGFDQDTISDSAMRMATGVTLPAGAFLHFRHSYGFEFSFDGGVIEYSTDGGTSWTDAGSLIAAGAGYGGTLSASFDNPLGGRSAFVGDSFGYTASRLNLSSLAGQTVLFRFRVGTDSSVGDYGWFIDDVRIHTCTAGNVPPSAVSVTPSSGSGTSQTFSYLFSDPDGFGDITSAVMLLNSSLNAANGCYLLHERSANRLWLRNDSDTAWLGPLTPGVAGTVENSQCIANAGSSSASSAGNNLTLNMALTFKAAFAGAKTNFMWVSDTVGQSSGWQAKGTWTVPGGDSPPSAVSVTPASGSGSVQTFTYLFSDPDGFGDITSAVMLLNSSLNAANGCYLLYERSTNRLWLRNDNDTVWLGPLTPGVAGTVENSQCIVNAGSSSASSAGNNLTLNMALTFKAAFAGAKTNFMWVSDLAGQSSGWQARGSWTVP